MDQFDPLWFFLFKESNFSSCFETWPVILSRYGRRWNSFPALWRYFWCYMFLDFKSDSSNLFLLHHCQKIIMKRPFFRLPSGMSYCSWGKGTNVLKANESSCMLLVHMYISTTLILILLLWLLQKSRKFHQSIFVNYRLRFVAYRIGAI